MQRQKQTLVQQQRLSLSPQLMQSIKLMAMPFADLRETIFEELEKNPALEVISDPFETSNRQMPAAPVKTLSLASKRGQEESDRHLDFIENALSRGETLQTHLLEQLGEMSVSGPLADFSALVIQNLDRDGFNIVPPEELPGAENKKLLEESVFLVQGMDPPGCATCGFQESLVVQARLLKQDTSSPRIISIIDKTIYILENHFSLLEKARPEVLVKNFAKNSPPDFVITLAEAEEILTIIRSLDPFPGRIFDSAPDSYIVPDVFVKRTEEGFSIVINDEEIPVLGISPFFKKMENEKHAQGIDAKETSSERKFVRESVKEARWFIHTLERRNQTIRKVASAIVDFQQNFFLYGPSRLAPLRMKDVAEEIGMHEATVSRAANGKYLQCSWGIFEIRYFFSTQVGSPRSSGTSSSAGQHSRQSVKEVIRQIIENSSEPLSDQKIADQLALRGIKIARRTVAKYRAELTIGSSYDR
ncbi:RNA polymerase factor sigma-54 [Brucepastera parasyntrophica]|uniref:RNA polymerase factor sigma-54 n=1 Tax=Brucepastera parasyntrophica TaxID=2880008 RepID=UPI00210EA6F9|nr:RNA polymerase factor sigma-54 [Brucepastera parasyntrophica]ULQ59371.1 RNA polymerase factor sigma-54 [Brucepastera parasyntrophica]